MSWPPRDKSKIYLSKSHGKVPASMMIRFNKHTYTGNEDKYISQALLSDKLSGDGFFAMQCHRWFEQKLGCSRSLLTPSCTAALELAAMLIDIQPGDEVIMPSYTFVSTANAFALRGARIVFVDIRPDTMNIDENLIEAAVTNKTKAIVPVHYAGVACEMGKIMEIAKKYSLCVIEDAAQAMLSTYNGKLLGTFGNIGAFSFHETKNFTSGGEGGLLILNDPSLIERAEILREKGTNRSKFFRGEIDKYSWVDVGSSYLPGELQAAFLWGQLEVADEIDGGRRKTWNQYFDLLKGVAGIELPFVPNNCTQNGHIFYIKTRTPDQRDLLINVLRKKYMITCLFHYVPLHDSCAGRKYSIFHGRDVYNTLESSRLLRVPIWHGLTQEQAHYVAESISAAVLELA
jgi:dTDP-4-amino-4,6-dideoxygalactose transaminase